MADELPPDPTEVPQGDVPPDALAVQDQPGPDPSIFLPPLGQVLGPPPQIPVPGPPPMPAPSAQDPKQHILAIAALGAMLGLGKQGGAGVGAGLLHAQAQMDAEHARQYQHAELLQQHAQAQAVAAQRQSDAIYEKRSQDFQKVLLGFRAQLDKTTSQDEYDRLITNYSGALQASGYPRATPQWFRQEFKFIPPTSEKTIETAIDKVVKSEPYKKATAANPDAWQTFAISVPLDPTHPKVLTTLPLPQAYRRLGVSQQVDPLGNVSFTALGKGTEEQNYITEATGAFVEQHGHAPRSAEDNTWIMDRVARRKADAQLEKKAPPDPLARELALQRLTDARDKRKGEQSTAADNGQQLVDGDLVPSQLSKRGGYNEALAEANRISKETTGQPFNAAKAQIQFEAAKRFSQSLNSTQQVRFKGLAGSVVNTIDEVKRLSELMNLSGFAAMNRIQLDATLKLEGNSEKGQLVAQYLGAVNTLKEEFANLVNGGMAPTEAAFALANQQINANYGVKAMGASLTEVQRLIKFRLGAFTDLAPSYGATPGGAGATTPVEAPTLIFDPTTKTFTRPRGLP